MNLLGELLTSSIGCFVQDIKKELLKSKKSEFNSNTCLTERHDNKVIISHWYIDLPELQLPFDKFMSLLEKWEPVCQSLPDQILITMDEDYNFTVKGIKIEK